jgi:hypothetical protein
MRLEYAANRGDQPMLEESTDPQPQHDAFARFLAACAKAGTSERTIEAWLRGWNDHASAWANVHSTEHWIERSRP